MNENETILQILDAAGEEGCLASEMLSLTNGHFVNVFNLGQYLRNMNSKGMIVGEGKNPTRWFLPKYRNGKSAPAAGKETPHAVIVEERTNGRIQLAEFASARAGTDVIIYASPEEFNNVVQVQVRQNGTWFKLPLWGALRICIGPGVPKWSVNQEVNLNITEIRVVFKGGEYKDIRVPPSSPVTIAPME